MKTIFEKFSSLNIRVLFIAGFSSLILLLVGTTLLNGTQVRVVGRNLEGVVAAADASQALAGFSNSALDTRRLVTQFIGSPTASAQVAAMRSHDALSADLLQLKHRLGLSTDDLSSKIDAYKIAFEKLVSQTNSRQAAYSTMVAAGTRTKSVLHALINTPSQENSYDKNALVRLQEAVQNYIDYATRFTMRGSAPDADIASAELSRIDLELAELTSDQTVGSWPKAALDHLRDPIKKLVESRSRLKEDTSGIQSTIVSLGTISDAIGSAVASLNETYLSQRAVSVDAARGAVASVLWWGAVASIAAVVIAVAISFVVISSIALLLRGITATMTVLANGDYSIAVPGSGRTDDIGKMARAVEVFRQNGLRNNALEFEAEQQRSEAETERQRNEDVERDRMEAMAHATAGLAKGLANVARGNLCFELAEPFTPDFEVLRKDFNTAVAQLRQTLIAVRDATSVITTGSTEISHGVEDLSRRTEQQAASLEQTAAALDEITTNVSNSSTRADEARNVANEANTKALAAEQVVTGAIEGMQRISSSSREISSIIGVIDEIAFQTNLLALNAGVEAARAGDAGKGFAVVAQEVRELAQRSAKAAREIKGLIANSTSYVEGGVTLVRDTGEALNLIKHDIVQMNEHMDAIAVSAREQALGLSEINVAVNQMDQVTQQNAAMVEQSSAASSILSSEVATLRNLISQFQLLEADGLKSVSSTAEQSHRGNVHSLRRR